MSGLGTKLRAIFSGRHMHISTDARPDAWTDDRSNTRHYVIDTRAVIAIRWLALTGQTITLIIVAFGLISVLMDYFDSGSITDSIGWVLIGVGLIIILGKYTWEKDE